jgi:WD40 repeat protein
MAPPQPPPLPPQKPPARAQHVFARITQQFISRPPSPHSSRDEPEKYREREKERAKPTVRQEPLSRSASYANHTPIASLDISPDRTRVVIAGKDIFKILSVSGDGENTISEVANLRASTSQYAAVNPKTSLSRTKDILAIGDVKWSGTKLPNVIATATTYGKIVLYDVTRPGYELTRLSEHQRSVHKLAFNPHDGRWLLSASQDGTVKLWDLREYASRNGLSGVSRSTKTINGRAEAVRDLKWSPTDGVEFAFATDNGSLQCWDFRKESTSLFKVAAHDGSCFACDYHPDGKHIASAGRDRCIKGWNVESKIRNHKPSWEIRTPQGINHLAWRPAVWDPRITTETGNGALATTQIAASYNQNDGRIQIWDFQRKYVPSREFEAHSGYTHGMLWLDSDVLWTVGRDGLFKQTDINFVAKPSERRQYQALDISSKGELGFFVSPSPLKRAVFSGEDFSSIRSRGDSSGDHLSGTRLDDAIDENALSSSNKKWIRSSSFKSQKSTISAMTVSSNGDSFWLLKDQLAKTPKFVPPQISGRQFSRPISEAQSYQYLAVNYILSADSAELSSMRLDKRYSTALDWNARLASSVGKYRAAQVWLIIRDALAYELQPQLLAWEEEQINLTVTRRKLREQEEQRPSSVEGSSILKRSLLDSGLASSSNMTTPLARPLPDTPRLGLTALRSPFGVSALRNFKEVSEIDNLSQLPPPASPELPRTLHTKVQEDDRAQPYPDIYGEGTGSDESLETTRNQAKPTLRVETVLEGSKKEPNSTDSLQMFSAGTEDWRDLSEPSSFDSQQSNYHRRDSTTVVSRAHNLPQAEDNTGQKGKVLHNGTKSNLSATSNVNGSTDTTSSEDSSLPHYIPSGDAFHSKTSVPPGFSPALGSTSRVGMKAMKESGTLRPPTPNLDDQKPSLDHSNDELDQMPDNAWKLPLYVTDSPEPYRLHQLATHSILHAIQTGDLQLATTLYLLLHDVVDFPEELLSAHDLIPAYYSQLVNRQLPVAAAFVKLLSHDLLFPENIGGDADHYMTLLCGRCRRPLENVASRRSAWWCDQCESLQDPCSICWERQGGRWSWCNLCGHGGHDGCLVDWFADAEGQCAGEGCGCTCVEKDLPPLPTLPIPPPFKERTSVASAMNSKSELKRSSKEVDGDKDKDKEKDRDRRVKLLQPGSEAVDIPGIGIRDLRRKKSL